MELYFFVMIAKESSTFSCPSGFCKQSRTSEVVALIILCLRIVMFLGADMTWDTETLTQLLLSKPKIEH